MKDYFWKPFLRRLMDNDDFRDAFEELLDERIAEKERRNNEVS